MKKQPTSITSSERGNMNNITNHDYSVNNDDSTIERCPHDEENPYAQINRDLIRDMTISPNCRWLIIYILSMKSGWEFRTSQIINHLKDQMGRDAVYKIIDEAIEAGYIKRVTKGAGNLKRYKYYVSERPKFKPIIKDEKPAHNESGRFPEFQDTENTDTKERTYLKKKKQQKEKDPDKPKVKKPDRGGGVFFDREKKKFENITPELISMLKETYAGVDVEQQLKEMALWLLNPANPHRIGNQSFITAWLKRNMNSKSAEKSIKPYEPYVCPPPPEFTPDPEMQELIRIRDEAEAKRRRESC